MVEMAEVIEEEDNALSPKDKSIVGFEISSNRGAEEKAARAGTAQSRSSAQLNPITSE